MPVPPMSTPSLTVTVWPSRSSSAMRPELIDDPRRRRYVGIEVR